MNRVGVIGLLLLALGLFFLLLVAIGLPLPFIPPKTGSSSEALSRATAEWSSWVSYGLTFRYSLASWFYGAGATTCFAVLAAPFIVKRTSSLSYPLFLLIGFGPGALVLALGPLVLAALGVPRANFGSDAGAVDADAWTWTVAILLLFLVVWGISIMRFVVAQRRTRRADVRGTRVRKSLARPSAR